MFKRVLTSTDFSAQGNRAVARGVEVAKTCQAELVLVHVVSSRIDEFSHQQLVSKLDEHQKALAKARVDLVKLVDDPSLTVTVDVRVGAPGDEILAAAEEHDADLLVIGTSGNRGVQRWFVGSNAERVVRGSLCDVLVVGARG